MREYYTFLLTSWLWKLECFFHMGLNILYKSGWKIFQAFRYTKKIANAHVLLQV